MRYKISIVIPCYNVEDTINRCINSIINQSFNFENIELIICDDGSTDNTKKIIQDYANKYENIIFLNLDKNQGPGNARNEGIKSVSSEFLMFIDSDDEYDKDMCRVLFNELTSADYDLVCSGNVNIVDGNFETQINDRNKSIIKNEEILYFEDIFIWDKIYKTGIIKQNNIFFPNNKHGEDLHFNIRYFLHCNKILHIPNYIGYYRHVHSDSISRSWTVKDLSRLLQTLENIFSELEERNVKFDCNKFFKYHFNLILFKLCALHLLNNKIEVKQLLNNLHSFEKQIMFTGSLSNKILDIANKFLLRKRISLCYYFLKVIQKLYYSHWIKKVYSKIFTY